MKLLSENDVRSLVDPDLAISQSAEAFRLLSAGNARIPLRTEISLSGNGVFFIMPGIVSERYLGFKLIANRPDTSDPSGLRTTSLIMIIDAESLQPLGLLSSDWFTDFRTAAGIAAATGKLAAPGAKTLAVFGAGKLAEPCIDLVSRVRDFDRIIIVGRARPRVEALAERLRTAGQTIDIDTGRDEAAEAADVIVTVTSSTTPVFDGARVRLGTHVNIGGAFRPEWREIDDAVAGRAYFYLDSEEACLQRSGDIRIPLEKGILSRERICGEIGLLFNKDTVYRHDPTKITVFKSLGNAVQDLHLGGQLLSGKSEAGLRFDLGT